MIMIEKYLGYWPVIVGSAVFLLIGLFLWLTAERGVERSRKSLSWVREYRQPGFPLRAEVLCCRPVPFWEILTAAVFALAVSVGLRVLASYAITGSYTRILLSRYYIVNAGVSVIGAVSVALLLHVLFDSRAVTVLGTLLFAAAPADGHVAACLIALTLLLLVLYLRCERSGFVPELLYLLAALAMACAIAVQPRTVFFAPFVVLAHWYKLISLRRADKLRFGTLVLALLAALICWCAFAVFSALLRSFMICNFGVRTLLIFLRARGLKLICAELYYFVLEQALAVPMRSLLLYPMLEAPLFGLGVFGAVSAVRIGAIRRNPRGWLCLIVLILTAAVWIATGCYTVTLGLALCLGCLLKNCVVGKKTGWAVAACVLGALYMLAIAASSWLLPLVQGLTERITA